MENWTKGPWGVERFSLSVEIKAVGNPLIAVVQSRYCDSPEEWVSNANLISASYELYDALYELAQWYEREMGVPALKANSALSKARGGDSESQFY